MSDESDAVLDRAIRKISDLGLHAFTYEGFVEEVGPIVREHFPDERSLLRAATAAVYRRVGERALAAIATAADGTGAVDAFLRAFVRYYLDNMHEFQFAFAVRQLVGYERFAFDETVQREMLLSVIASPLAAVEAKLLADRGSRELPGGIHPRRLAFVAQMAAVGMLATKGLSLRIGSPLKHRDEELLQEISRAVAGPIKSLGQLTALNEAAVELARLREEAALRNLVPALMSRALGLDVPVFALELQGSLDREVNQEAERAFQEKSSRFAALAAGEVWLAAPVRYEGEVAGVIAGRRSGALETDERDLARLDAFAAIVGMTLENVRLYEDLQRQLDARTKHLAEAQLRLAESEKMAALGKLVAGVVHELNTPLGAVQSSQATLVRAIEKLKEKLHAEATPLLGIVAQTADGISTGVRRISEIVAQLKRFSRLDAAELERMDVGDALRDAIAMLRHEANCSIDLEVAELPPITGWAARINQVFLAVIRNAIEAEGRSVRVSARPANAREVSIVVEDDGRGIPLEDQARVFEPGFTAKGGRVRAGLGLATAYQVVADHGGQIRLESEVGKGTRVTIVLPVVGPK